MFIYLQFDMYSTPRFFYGERVVVFALHPRSHVRLCAEVWAMSRRVVLIVADVFLILHPQWRLATLTLLLQAFLVIQRQLLPFNSQLENVLETGSLLVLTFIAVILVGDTSTSLSVGSPYSQRALDAVSVLVLVPVLGMLALWAISIASRVPCIDRLLSSRSPGLHNLIKPAVGGGINGAAENPASSLELQVQPASHPTAYRLDRDEETASGAFASSPQAAAVSPPPPIPVFTDAMAASPGAQVETEQADA